MTTNNTPDRTGQDQLISFMYIRQAIGYLGIIFPLILYIGTYSFNDCNEGLSSISAYYHTIMRDVFVGVICVIGVFLFTYRGHNYIENRVSNFACLFAFGIAFLPTEAPTEAACVPCKVNDHSILHGICAAGFFLILTYFAWKLFPKNEESHENTPQREKRIKTYKTCAIIMFISIILIAINWVFLEGNKSISKLDPVFYLEWAALWAFGVSWIVRGGAFLKD